MKMDELQNILTAYEMRTRNSSNKEETFKAYKKSRKWKYGDYFSDEYDTKWTS